MSTGLTLYGIEASILECQELVETAETPAEKKAAQDALAVYVAQELEKVDNIRAYLRHCARMADAARDEARVQAKRAEAWEERGDRLKEMVKAVMDQRQRKRLEGKTGTLRIQGNGGLKPLKVSDESLLPDDLIRVTLTMTLRQFRLLPRDVEYGPTVFEVDNDAVRAALSRGPVAGAHLEERGEHLRVV